MNIILISEIKTISTLSDNTIKVVLNTQEMDSTSISELFELRNKSVKVLVSDVGINQSMIEELEKVMIDIEDNGKSPAQRQKAVLYRLWETDNEGYEDHNLYYKYKMEKNIEHYKSILRERTT